MIDNEFPMCKHQTPDYADCDACADENGMRFVTIDGKATLVYRDEFARLHEAIVRLLPTNGGWCYGNTHPDTAIAADRIAADLAKVAPGNGRMDRDAQAIADALFNSLPGGTLDRLTVLFLRRKISHFIVSHR